MKSIISLCLRRRRVLSPARYLLVSGFLALFSMASVVTEASVAPTKPVVVDGATVSGLPAVKLDGTGTFLEIASNPNDFDGLSPGKTTLIVFRPSPDGFAANQRLFASGYERLNSTGDPISHYQVNTVFLTTNRQFRYQQRTSEGGAVSVTVEEAGAMSTEDFTIGVNLLFGDGSSAAGIRNAANVRAGIFSESIASAVLEGHTFTRIGGASAATNPTAYEAFYNGEIAAVLIYNRSLSFDELISVEEFLYEVYMTELGGNPNVPPVTDGLVVHINAGNVEVADGFVTRMTDLSGRSNHADTFVALENRLRVVSQWTNAGEGSWGDVANWNPLLPTSIDTVRIDNGGTAVIGADVVAEMRANNGGVGVDAGTSGTLRVEEGGTLLGGQHLNVGNNSTGDMIQQGGLVEINNLSFVGRRAGGSGTYRMLGGVFNTNDILRVGDSATSTGVFEMEGGEVYARNAIEAGSRGGQGTWTMSGGLVRLPTGPFLVGNAVASVGTLNLDGGIIQARGLGLAISGDATGTVNWNGGEVQAGSQGIYGGANGVLNWGGGILRPVSGNLVIGNHATTLTLVGGGSGPVISSRGADGEPGSVTIANSFGGSADVTIDGDGVVVFAAEQSYTGTTTVAEGTLQVDGALASGNLVTVQAGATLSGSGTIGGATTVLGKLAPGGVAGNVLTFGSNLDLSGVAAGDLQFLIGQVGESSSLLVNGVLNLGTVNFSDFAFIQAIGLSEGEFVLFEAQEIIGEIGGESGTLGGANASLALVNNQLVLTVDEVPAAEESFWAVADGQWDVPANWDPEGVPGASNAVRIGNGGIAELTGSSLVDSLTIRGGSDLLVGPGADLTTSNFILGGVDFVIEGDGGSLTVSGQVSSSSALWGNLDRGSIDTKSESFDSAESAAANGWVEMFSRQDGMDFGFSDTNIAGGAATGEAGGVFKRNSTRHMYADVFDQGKLLTLDDEIMGSGKIRVPALPTGNAGVVVGHTDSTLAGGTTQANALGLVVASNPRFFVYMALASGAVIESVILNPVQTDRVYEWTYAYDPDGGNGFGQLVATFTDTVTKEVFSGTITLNEAQRQVGAFFNAFGLTSRALSAQDVQNEFYIDDVTYSMPPVPAGPGDVVDSTVVIDGGSFVAANDIRLAGGDSVLQVILRNGGTIEAGNRFLAEAGETGVFTLVMGANTQLRQGDAVNGVAQFRSLLSQGLVQFEHTDGPLQPLPTVFVDAEGFAVLRADLALPVSQDADIDGLAANVDTNFGDSNVVRVGNSGSSHGGRKSYFLFDATGLPEVTSIDNFEVIRNGGTTSRSVRLVAILGDNVNTWTEQGITWNNAPGNNVGPASRDFAAFPGEEIIVLAQVSTGGVNPGDILRFVPGVGITGFSETDRLAILNALNTGNRTLTLGLQYISSQQTTIPFRSKENAGGVFAPRLNLVTAEEPSEPGLSFADWAAGFELPTGQDGPGDNPAGDGIVNVLKFALGLNPNEPARGGLPFEQIQNIGGQLYLTLTFDRPLNVSGVTYHVDASSDLAAWPDAAVELPNPTTNGDGTERVTFRDVEPLEGLERRFLRMRVELDE